jgi:hypothetical protein
MDINETTFGVEIECVIPIAVSIAVGGYHHGIQVPELPTGWNAQSDSSVCARSRYRPVEIVSPILKGAEGIAQVVTVIKWLRAVGAKVNYSCGFHVHVGWTADDAALGRLVHLVSANETGLYASSGSRGRERGGYCQPIRNDNEFVKRFVNKVAPERCYITRYKSLNITNVRTANKRTVEVRVFSGTLNVIKAVAYIRLSLGMVHKAVTSKRTCLWTSKSPATCGRQALDRLMFSLGWMRSEDKATQFGICDDVRGIRLPSFASSRRVLAKLAAKYDGQPII